MTKRLISGLLLATLASAFIAGCSGGSKDAEAPPKGDPPKTVNAPPGAQDPETRGMAEQKAREGGGGGGN